MPTKNLIPAPKSKAGDDDLLCELFATLRDQQREAYAERFKFVTIFGTLLTVLSAVALVPFFTSEGAGNIALNGYIICLMAAAAILILISIGMERGLQIRARQAEYILRLKGRQKRLVSAYPDPFFPGLKQDWMDRMRFGKLFILFFTLHFSFLLYLLLTYLGNSLFPDMSYSPFAAVAAAVFFILAAGKLWRIDEGRGLEALNDIPVPAGMIDPEQAKREPPPPVGLNPEAEAAGFPDWGDVLASSRTEEHVGAPTPGS